MTEERQLEDWEIELKEKTEKAKKMMSFLGIPVHGRDVSILHLYDLFMNIEKMEELLSKLRLKAFW